MRAISLTLIILYFFTKSLTASEIQGKDNVCSLTRDSKYFAKSASFNNFMNGWFVLSGFERYSQLNFNCSSVILVLNLILLPNNDLFLDNTFDLISIVYKIQPYYKKSITISFFRIRGFNYVGFKYLNITDFSILISFGRFDFYLNNKLIDENECVFDNFKNRTSFFGSITELRLGYNVVYSKKTCPYVFMNSYITQLSISKIINSFIYKNQLEFIDLNKPSNFSLNNKVLRYLNIEVTYESLSSKIINPHVFKYMKCMTILGIVYNIENKLFSNFKKLRLLQFIVSNLRQLLQNNNKWLMDLNSDVNVDFTNSKTVANKLSYMFIIQIVQKGKMESMLDSVYEFPDEDFCLFQHFPHKHMVYPSIISANKLECSCTIIWLIQYSDYYLYGDDYKKFRTSNYYYMDYIFENTTESHKVKFCLGKNLKKRIWECNFDQRLKLCNKTSFENSKISTISLFNNAIDFYFLIKWLKLIIFVFLEPALSLLGIVTNLLTIIVLKRAFAKNEMKDSMYKHIFYNSIFNVLFCFLTLFKLINVCIFDSTIFCSTLYYYVPSQLFKIIFILFFGNVIKLCCNFSYISFTFSRFCLSTNKKSGIYKKFDGLNLKFYYTLMFIFGVLLSLFKLFQYDYNYIYNLNKSFPFEIYDVGNCESTNYKCILFRALKLINDIIKNILTYMISFLIDIILMKNIRKDVENKLKLTKSKKTISTAIHSLNNANRMVLVNGIVFFVAYSPEFIVNILLVVLNNHLYLFCAGYISCNDFNELAEVFNFFSISFQFFIFKSFNKLFKENYQEFLESFRVKKKFKNKKLKS